MFTVGAFGLYTTTVTTLAARRQNLFLKRLRSTAASDTGILFGLLLPVAVISLVQVAVILDRAGRWSPAPDNILLLAAAVVATVIMMLGLALATGGSDELPRARPGDHAARQPRRHRWPVWVGITGTEELTLLKRLLPGGSATELVVNAWNGGVPAPTP